MFYAVLVDEMLDLENGELGLFKIRLGLLAFARVSFIYFVVKSSESYIGK